MTPSPAAALLAAICDVLEIPPPATDADRPGYAATIRERMRLLSGCLDEAIESDRDLAAVAGTARRIAACPLRYTPQDSHRRTWPAATDPSPEVIATRLVDLMERSVITASGHQAATSERTTS